MIQFVFLYLKFAEQLPLSRWKLRKIAKLSTILFEIGFVNYQGLLPNKDSRNPF